MFGIVDVWVDSETRVPFFDRERTILDAFLQTRAFGRGHLGEMLVAAHHDALDQDRLAGYAEKDGARDRREARAASPQQGWEVGARRSGGGIDA